MPRTTKKTAVIDPNAVNIADFCASQGINEQIFRLELMPHLDNADSAKVVEFDLARTVAEQITASKAALPAQTSNTTETTSTAENLTPSELEPSTETASNQPQKPQNSHIVPNTPYTPSVPTQGQKTNLPSALDELIASAEDDINLADLVLVYRNQQIAQNAQARDSELVVQLRERRLERRNQVFAHIRDLNGRQPIAPELPELPASLTDEIKALADELGKSLIVG
jgi:hypothetical protein